MMTPLPKRNKSIPPQPRSYSVPKAGRPKKILPQDVHHNSSDDDADNDARVEALRIGKPHTAKDRIRILNEMENPESSTSAALLKEQSKIREMYPNLFPAIVATILSAKQSEEVKTPAPKRQPTRNKIERDTGDKKTVRATRNGTKRLKLNEDKGELPEENEMKDGMPILLAESYTPVDANATTYSGETEMEDEPPVLLLYGVSSAITRPSTSTPVVESVTVPIIKEKRLRLGNSSHTKLDTGILQVRKLNVSVGPAVAVEEKEILNNGTDRRTRSSRRISSQKNENGIHERISVAVTGRKSKI
ncbi:unnamed protein product [Orchesella dallaii]|uniref:Uncharacterized protein n=1 Tax=Orchesella dallaii TaxID=48710 RepID=A0ABP1RC16_9HEXA